MHQERDRLAHVLAAFEPPTGEDQSRYAVFLAWAQQKLAKLDRELTPEALACSISTMTAFEPVAFGLPGQDETM